MGVDSLLVGETMNDGDAMLRAILLQHHENTPRLMYADWLQDTRPEETC